jgi:putative PIN family toxin of toxin-antitoxin system
VRAVIDANVWVSGALSRTGPPARVITVFLDGRFKLVTSEPLLAEIQDVMARPHLARRSRLTRTELRELLQAMRDLGEVVAVTGVLRLCRDPDDDVVIETAIVAGADVLVSGDRDLIADPPVRGRLLEHGVRVLSVAEFVAELAADAE